jgi:tetratricopeptide (TPR) repeat protein
MKKLMCSCILLLATSILAVYLTRPGKLPPLAAGSSVQSNPPYEQRTSPLAAPPPPHSSTGTVQGRAVSPNLPPHDPTVPAAEATDPVARATEVLVSPQSTYAQKQNAWHELSSTNLLDQAIASLEQQIAANPTIAQPHAILGMAYLHKCGLIKDVREMGILAMNADKSFDKALEIDPANWDARFTKAVAMSMWPAQLNKGGEVLEHFRLLVQQQESQPPQPQFAMTYIKLGDQYKTAGYADYAREAFERGATLFPENKDLQTRLNQKD